MKEEQFWILLAKKLNGEANAEELALLQENLNENNEWQIAHDRLLEFCNSEPEISLLTNDKAEDSYLNLVNKLKSQVSDFEEVVEYDDYINTPTNKNALFTNWFKIGASAIVVGFALFYWISSNNSAEVTITKYNTPKNEVKVGLGSKSKVQLPDGTLVWINSGSKLTYEGSFKGKFREVVLNGEAYFDVVRDPEHPFVVHTSNIDIKVLGTAFNVKAYDIDKTIEATLIHGSIEVMNINQPDAPKVMLKPHEKIIFHKDISSIAQKTSIETTIAPENLSKASSILITPLPKNIADSSIIETSWVYNRIVFDDEKLSDVAIKLERWYDVKISILDDKIKNYKISGSFVDEPIDEAMRDLQLLIPFKYQIKNNMITINKK